MLRFISFGSGSSGNCYYLFTETDGLLIDTGIGIRTLKKQFKDYSLSLSKVKHILITHDHADHIKSVGNLSYDYQLPVYTTHEVHAGINKNYCVQRKINTELVKEISKNCTFTLGDFTITPFEVPHDSTDNVGYRIEYQDIVFCLLTDVGHVTERMTGEIADANYLVIEANYDEEMLKNGHYPQYLKDRIMSGEGHLSNRACGEALAAYSSDKLKQVWLCHLSEENNHPELARITIENYLRSREHVRPVALEVLKRKTPTGIFDIL